MVNATKDIGELEIASAILVGQVRDVIVVHLPLKVYRATDANIHSMAKSAIGVFQVMWVSAINVHQTLKR